MLNDTLADRFLTHEGVNDHAEEHARIDDEGNMIISSLEDMLSRYNVRLHEYVNYGVDDNHPVRDIEFITKDDLGPNVAEGKFQVFFILDEPKSYPLDGPFRYGL